MLVPAYIASDNHTPGNKSYSNFVDTWADSDFIHQLLFKPS